MNLLLLLLSSFIVDADVLGHSSHGHGLVDALGDVDRDHVTVHSPLKGTEVESGRSKHYEQDIFVPVAHNVYVPIPIPLYVPVAQDVPIRVPYQSTQVINVGVPHIYDINEDVYVDVPYPLAFPVAVEKIVKVDVPYTVPIEKPIRKEIPVEIPIERRIPVTRATPVEVDIQNTKYIHDPYDVIVHVPVGYNVNTTHHVKKPVYIPYPYEVFEPVPYDVPVPYTLRKTTIIDKDVPYQYKVPKTYEVNYPVPVPVYRPHSVPYPVTVEKAVPVYVPVSVYRPVRINVPVDIPVSMPVPYNVPVKYVVYVPEVQEESVDTFLEVPVPYDVQVPIPYEVYYPVSYKEDRRFPKPYIVEVPEEIVDEIPIIVDDVQTFPVEDFVPHPVEERYPKYEARYHPVSYEILKNSYYDVPYDIVVPVPVEHRVYSPEPYQVNIHKDVFVPEPYHIFDPMLPDVQHEHEFIIDLNPNAPVYHQDFFDSDIHQELFSGEGKISGYKGIDDIGGILAEHGSLINGYSLGYDPLGYRHRNQGKSRLHAVQTGHKIDSHLGGHHQFEDPFGHSIIYHVNHHP